MFRFRGFRMPAPATLPGIVFAHARERPTQCALEVWSPSQGVTLRVTYKELADMTCAAASFLSSSGGIQEGDRVAFLAHNTVAYVALSLGVSYLDQRLSATVDPRERRNAPPALELGRPAAHRRAVAEIGDTVAPIPCVEHAKLAARGITAERRPCCRDHSSSSSLSCSFSTFLPPSSAAVAFVHSSVSTTSAASSLHSSCNSTVNRERARIRRGVHSCSMIVQKRARVHTPCSPSDPRMR